MPYNEKNKNFRNYKISRWLEIGGVWMAPFALAILFSLWLSDDQRELSWQREWFDAGSDSWPVGDRPFWDFIYHYAAIPVMIVCGGAIVVLIIRFRYPVLNAWRRIAWFALALLFIGPGLITNLWMKDNWGRPRPREISEFGGREAFEPVFGLDFAGQGKSFPCGHATMGFYFLGAFFLLRRRYPKLAWATLIAAMGWGALIGYARMVQGGHFASDVVWAAAIMWITAAILFRVFRLDRRLLDAPGNTQARKIPWPVKLAGGAAILVLIGGILLATPYHDRGDLKPIEPVPADAKIKGSLRVELGDVEIVPASEVSIYREARGHGVPTSQIAQRWEEEFETPEVWRFKYLQRYSGRFTEIGQRMKVGLPWEQVTYVKFDLGPGETRLRLPKPVQNTRIDLLFRGATLIISADEGVSIDLEETPPGLVIEGKDPFLQEAPESDAPSYQITVSGNEGGRIVFEREEE